MIQGLLSAFGLNLLSAGAYDLFSRRLLENVRRQDRLFAKHLRNHLKRTSGIEVDLGVLIRIVLSQNVWLPLLCGDPGDSSWEELLLDVMPTSQPMSYESLAEAISKGIRAVASRDIQATMEQLATLLDVQSTTEATQRELAELRSAIEAMLPALETPEQVAPEVSAPVKSGLARLNILIEQLTNEQTAVIRTLHGVRRAVVSGTAGSGKTVVACEKAVRLDVAGLKTLLMCHNPWLVAHLEALTVGTGVDVLSFGDLMRSLTQPGSQRPPSDEWTYYDEPTDEQLIEALDVLAGSPRRWDAIIVDEGQDFRPDWWDILETALRIAPGILYVFVDDDQRILAARDYPAAEYIQPMTRNCRNSGSVYSAMRTLVPGLARPEANLLNEGEFHLFLARPGGLLEALPLVSAHLDGLAPLESVTILVATGEVEPVVEQYPQLPITHSPDWRGVVVSEMEGVLRESQARTSPLPGHPETSRPLAIDALAGLSHSPSPNISDVALVCSFAKEIQGCFPRILWDRLPQRPRPHFLMDEHVLVLRKLFHSWSTTVAFFASPTWIDTVPTVQYMSTRPYGYPAQATHGYHATVSEVGAFKGLEVDTAIVIWDPNKSPFPEIDLYVAVSRARYRALVIAPVSAKDELPQRLRARARSPYTT